MNIYNYNSQPSKIIFAFISTCMSADTSYGQGWLPPQPPYSGRARGLPFAFTHRLVADKSTTPGFNIAQYISDDGYGDPDWAPQVYIGFPYGSASLYQGIPYGEGNPYYYWVYSFFYHALSYDLTVNQALDSASWQFMGSNFGGSWLRTGFDAVWPFDKNGDGIYEEWEKEHGAGSTMAIYGNGNIRLGYFTPPPDSASTPSVSGPTTGDIGVSYEFSAFSTNPYGHDIKYRFDWGDGSPYTETGWYSDGATGYASHSWSTGGQKTVKVQARCPNSGWSSWSNPYTVQIGVIYYWLYVDAYCDYFGGVVDPYVWIDGNEIGQAPVYILVQEGWHTVTVEWNWGYWHLLGFSDGYGNGESRPIYSDTDITAYYGW
jgi:hypothetical protein